MMQASDVAGRRLIDDELCTPGRLVVLSARSRQACSSRRHHQQL